MKRLADFPFCHQSLFYQFKHIGSCRLIHDIVGGLMLLDRIPRVGMPERVRNHIQLSFIKYRFLLGSTFNGAARSVVSIQVAIEFLDGPFNDSKLMQQEIGNVIAVRFGQQEGPGVLYWCVA